MSITVPTFVVAGAARSGTTSVAEALRARPDAFLTQPKEPHYFAFANQEVAFTGPGDEILNQVAITERRQYLALYPVEHSYRALGDGSVTSLYYHDRALPEMVSVNPDIKAVIILRDPVERAFSSYQYLRARGFEPLSDFREALAEEQRRIEKGWQHLWHYSAMSYYADAVENFIRTLGKEQVGVWFYDDLARDSTTVTAQIAAFLDLDPIRHRNASAPRVNVSGRPRSLGVQRLIQAATRQQGLRRFAKAVVPFGIRERIRRANLQASSVPEDVRQLLAPRFGSDLERLSELLDRPLPGWPRV